jgi:hypothetical protein
MALDWTYIGKIIESVKNLLGLFTLAILILAILVRENKILSSTFEMLFIVIIICAVIIQLVRPESFRPVILKGKPLTVRMSFPLSPEEKKNLNLKPFEVNIRKRLENNTEKPVLKTHLTAVPAEGEDGDWIIQLTDVNPDYIVNLKSSDKDGVNMYEVGDFDLRMPYQTTKKVKISRNAGGQ